MLVIKNKGFARKYAYGGRGILDSIASLFSRFFTSDAAKAITSSALDIGKKAAKEVGKKALDIGKETAIKAVIEKALTPKAKNILQKYNLPATTKAQDINNLMMGSGGSIEIQKLVKKLASCGSGGGMKIT